MGAAVATLYAHITFTIIIPAFYSRDCINVQFFFEHLSLNRVNSENLCMI